MSTQRKLIQSLLNTSITMWRNAGSVEVLEENPGHEDYDENSDILIYYNYCDDGLSSQDQEDFNNWFDDKLFLLIDQVMIGMNYERVDEMDGSGGGLYYGSVQYRK